MKFNNKDKKAIKKCDKVLENEKILTPDYDDEEIENVLPSDEEEPEEEPKEEPKPTDEEPSDGETEEEPVKPKKKPPVQRGKFRVPDVTNSAKYDIEGRNKEGGYHGNLDVTNMDLDSLTRSLEKNPERKNKAITSDFKEDDFVEHNKSLRGLAFKIAVVFFGRDLWDRISETERKYLFRLLITKWNEVFKQKEWDQINSVWKGRNINAVLAKVAEHITRVYTTQKPTELENKYFHSGSKTDDNDKRIMSPFNDMITKDFYQENGRIIASNDKYTCFHNPSLWDFPMWVDSSGKPVERPDYFEGDITFNLQARSANYGGKYAREWLSQIEREQQSKHELIDQYLNGNFKGLSDEELKSKGFTDDDLKSLRKLVQVNEYKVAGTAGGYARKTSSRSVDRDKFGLSEPTEFFFNMPKHVKGNVFIKSAHASTLMGLPQIIEGSLILEDCKLDVCGYETTSKRSKWKTVGDQSPITITGNICAFHSEIVSINCNNLDCYGIAMFDTEIGNLAGLPKSAQHVFFRNVFIGQKEAKSQKQTTVAKSLTILNTQKYSEVLSLFKLQPNVSAKADAEDVAIFKNKLIEFAKKTDEKIEGFLAQQVYTPNQSKSVVSLRLGAGGLNENTGALDRSVMKQLFSTISPSDRCNMYFTKMHIGDFTFLPLEKESKGNTIYNGDISLDNCNIGEWTGLPNMIKDTKLSIRECQFKSYTGLPLIVYPSVDTNSSSRRRGIICYKNDTERDNTYLSDLIAVQQVLKSTDAQKKASLNGQYYIDPSGSVNDPMTDEFLTSIIQRKKPKTTKFSRPAKNDPDKQPIKTGKRLSKTDDISKDKDVMQKIKDYKTNKQKPTNESCDDDYIVVELI